jgi:hypothetical protein
VHSFRVVVCFLQCKSFRRLAAHKDAAEQTVGFNGQPVAVLVAANRKLALPLRIGRSHRALRAVLLAYINARTN